MDIKEQLHQSGLFFNLGLLAKQVVEGYISGIHKSPFHGFSSEFAEHKLYNSGESTKHIDWKLFAKTDRLYTKRYEEETNLRCHFILDNSSSMHFPKEAKLTLESLNKIGFGVLAIAALAEWLKRQRDAIGLSIYSEELEFYAPEMGSERHFQMLLTALNQVGLARPAGKGTNTYHFLHQIAEKMKRRSLIFLFSDMLQPDVEEQQLFEALRHLKYNKHEVFLFHLMDKKVEVELDLPSKPTRFIDVETDQQIDLFPDQIKTTYQEAIKNYQKRLELKCLQYNLGYRWVDVGSSFAPVLNAFLVERQKFK